MLYWLLLLLSRARRDGGVMETGSECDCHFWSKFRPISEQALDSEDDNLKKS